MKIGLAAVCGALMASCWLSPCFAQGRDEAQPAGETLKSVRYDAETLISPSSGTTTISPSTVPQALERLSNDQATASVSLGTIYAGGKFGTGSVTSVWSSALGVRLRGGDWTLSASLPWMRIQSRSTIFTGIDSTPVLVAPDTAAANRTTNGLGDLTIGASYTIAPESSPVELELSGRAKLNTAPASSRLSSGENDYAVAADISLPVGYVTPFASVTYRFLGDSAAYTLRDGPAASVGASYALRPETYVLLSYHYSRGATRLVNDAHEAFLGASTRVSRTPLRVTAFSTAGLSRGAADVSAGLALSTDLGKRYDR